MGVSYEFMEDQAKLRSNLLEISLDCMGTGRDLGDGLA